MSKKKSRTQAEIAADAFRTGRPPVPREQKRSEVISVRTTLAERMRLRREADRRGIGVSDLLMEPWRESQ
jgi:hypothetical protein